MRVTTRPAAETRVRRTLKDLSISFSVRPLRRQTTQKPLSFIQDMEKAAKPAEEGKRICVELIQQIREIKGVAGIHVMAYRREHQVSEIILESGVLKGRVPQRQRGARLRPTPG